MKSVCSKSLSTETFEYRHYSQCNRAISRLRRHIVPEKGRSTSVWGDLTEVRVAIHIACDELGVCADSTYDGTRKFRFKALAHFYDTFSKGANIHRILNWFLLKLLYSNGHSWGTWISKVMLASASKEASYLRPQIEYLCQPSSHLWGYGWQTMRYTEQLLRSIHRKHWETVCHLCLFKM